MSRPSRDSTAEPGAQLLAFLMRKSPDGQYLYDSRAVKDLFCLLLLRSGASVEQVPPMFRRLLGEFVLKIGFSSRSSPLSLSESVDIYFLSCPLDPRLVADFRIFLRDELGFEAPSPLRKDLPIRG